MGMGKGRMHESVKTFHTLHQLLEHWYINHSDDETYSHWFELLEKKNTIAKASEEEDRERLNHKTPPLEPNDSLGDGSEAEFIMTSLSSPANTPPPPPPPPRPAVRVPFFLRNCTSRVKLLVPENLRVHVAAICRPVLVAALVVRLPSGL